MQNVFEGWKPADLDGPDYNDEWHPKTDPDQFYTLDRCRCCQRFDRVYISEEFTPEKGWICYDCLKPLGWKYVTYSPPTLEWFPPVPVEIEPTNEQPTTEQMAIEFKEVSGL